MSDTKGATTRRAMWDRLASGRTEVDLLIVGGGINGAGIARDAARRGLSVAVVEMRDLAFGTSSRSSKLIHGGPRYLEQYEVGLVFESVSVRRILMDLAPHPNDEDFETLVTHQVRRLRIREPEKYDVVIVDEAQDLQDAGLSFIFARLLKGKDPKQKNLLLAADDAQRVYKSRTFSWKGLGIPIQADRSRVLRKIYRNSARVWGYAGLLLGDISKYYDESSQIQFTPKRGVDPKIVECRTLREQIEYCVRDIKEIGRNGYSWRNVMVLYNGTASCGR